MRSSSNRALPSQRLGHAIIHLQQTTSTNDVARDMARRGAPDGALVLADAQTAGRGRRGRAWNAPAGQCLLCSLILRPALAPARATRLTMLAAVAIARAILALGLPAVLKWPNDILINGRKAGGILTEAQTLGDKLEHVIVGLGINVNVSAGGLTALAPRATSLLAEGGQPVEREHLLRLLLAEMEAPYLAMTRDGGEAVFQEWRVLLETLGRDVHVTTDSDVIEGRAEDVDGDGALLVRQTGGQLVRVSAGDVS